MFGEEVKKVQPDEFFGYFDQFLTGLAEARVDNRVMMKQKEDEEKKAQRDAEVRELTDAFLWTQGFFPASIVSAPSFAAFKRLIKNYNLNQFLRGRALES